MGSSFYIRVPDATEIDEGYGMFACDMEDVISNAAMSIDTLVTLDSLSGKGAEAIKAYFTQVHHTLLYLFSLLVNELDAVYNCPYYQRILFAARNDGAGKFPSWDLWDKARAFESFANGDVPPIDSLMRAAVQAAPAGYSFSTPNTAAFSNGMGAKSRKLDTTRENFENAESMGVNALTSTDDNYQQLYQALSDAISRCANGAVSMASYKSGDFRVATSDLGLQQIAMATQEEQDAKSDIVIATKQQGAENRALDIERARREAEEAKKTFAAAGEILQVAILGAAIAGLCVATGGVAIAFSAVAVASATAGLAQRESQRQAMKKNARADLDKDGFGGKALKDMKDMKDYGKGLDTVARNMRQIADDEANGLQYGPIGASRNIDRTVTGMAVSATTQFIGNVVDSNMGDKLEGDSKLYYKEGKKVAEKAIDIGSDKALEHAFPKMQLSQSFRGSSILDGLDVYSKVQKGIGRGAGVVGFVAGCAQIYTDHQVEQYDQILDKCEADREKNESYRQSIGNGSGYQWAVQW